MYTYIKLHYIKQDGSKGVFRASPNHGIILPTDPIPANSPVAAPGLGAFKPMSKVQVSRLAAPVSCIRNLVYAHCQREP